MEQIEKNIKTLRLVAMILGLVGSGSVLLSLMTDAYYVNTALGKLSVSMTKYMSGLILFVILLAGCSVAFSLLKLAVPQIITGSFTTFIAAFMLWHIKSKESAGKIQLSISFGTGAYLFFLAAALMLAAGIIYVIAANKAKAAGIEDPNEAKRKKICKIIYICLGALLVLCIGVVILSAVVQVQAKKKAQGVVSDFLTAATAYDVDKMNTYLSPEVNDKNGLMEAYTPEVMNNAFLSVMGVTENQLGEESRKCLTESSIYFGKSYIKSYGFDDVTKNDDGSYTVTVHGKIIDMSNTNNTLKTRSAEIAEDYATNHLEEIYKIALTASGDEATAQLMDLMMPDICGALNDAIKDAGEQETTFTFVVSKVSGDYKITEIDYKD